MLRKIARLAFLVFTVMLGSGFLFSPTSTEGQVQTLNQAQSKNQTQNPIQTQIPAEDQNQTGNQAWAENHPSAQNYNTNETLDTEMIEDFSSIIVVNTDNSIDVTEKISYNTGYEERHGLYRDIRLISSQNQKISIENLTVTDEEGNPYLFNLSGFSNRLHIKIGDPNQVFKGRKTYIIKYKATKAIAQFKNFDEIYWNVTGNSWNGLPIERVTGTVILPDGAKVFQEACYFGEEGSAKSCETRMTSENKYTFSTSEPLRYYAEGVTVAFGFSKGIVTPYTTAENIYNFLYAYQLWLAAAIFPILAFIFSLWSWFRNGRDDRKTRVIVPQFDVIDNLSPMEVDGIVNERSVTSGLSAQIIYLATKGYLKIIQLDERFIDLVKSNDYKFIKLKEPDDLENAFDRRLMENLFMKAAVTKNPETGEEITAIELSELKHFFFLRKNSIVVSVLDALLNKGYYKNLGKIKRKLTFNSVFLVLFVTMFFSLIITYLLHFFHPLAENALVPFFWGILSAIIIHKFIYYFSPAKTEKGVTAKEHLLGLKEYLQIAEKDRLRFHNAPEKKPETFEKLLPYAMVFGVADAWAKEFEGLYTDRAPSWYSGPEMTAGTAFSFVAFNKTMSNFSSSTELSFAASYAGSSGSGGGGFSGGGGGGGGGGSW